MGSQDLGSAVCSLSRLIHLRPSTSEPVSPTLNLRAFGTWLFIHLHVYVWLCSGKWESGRSFVTLASSPIFDAFFSDKKADALLHGHSYTAHAIGCEVANGTMEMMDKLVDSESWTRMKNSWKPSSKLECTENSIWSFWSPSFVTTLSNSPVIDSVMTLGTVLAFKFKGSSDGKPLFSLLIWNFFSY